MSNHSLINASGGTHAKIGLIALAVALGFVAIISALAVSTPHGARTDGSIVKPGSAVRIADR